MYADDLLTMSPSPVGLQHILDICTPYGHDFDLTFNVANSVCVTVGKKTVDFK